MFTLGFYYQKKLHYSQTRTMLFRRHARVLLPKEITLLSNHADRRYHVETVLLPKEITLLSNRSYVRSFNSFVLLPKEITLLSNFARSIVY